MNMSNDVESTLVALSALGWEPLEAERKKTKAKLIFKLLNEMGPKSLSSLFDSFCLPQPRTNSMKKSFIYDGATLWNLGTLNPLAASKQKFLLT